MTLYFLVFWLSLCYTASALTTTEKRKILDLHNQLRDRVAGGGLINAGHPAATNMNSLIWDDGLAKLAYNYIKKCTYPKHNPNAATQIIPIRDNGQTKWGKKNGKTLRTGGKKQIWVGENLGARTGYPNGFSIQTALNVMESGWFNEYKSWKWGPAGKGCSRTYCTHYTQMVWADTRYVGCAWYNGCKTSSGKKKAVLGCNYFPLGNLNSASTPPYKATWKPNLKASWCMTDRTIKGFALYQNVAPYSSSTKKYKALCGGGACATMCDGDSTNRKSCDECSTTNADCNDGTTSRTSGRNVCTDGNRKVSVPVWGNGLKCPANKPFACRDGSKCIPQSYVCDKYTDCPDKSDMPWITDCSGKMESDGVDCMDGYKDNVCTTPHDSSDTNFVISDSAVIVKDGYKWTATDCMNDKPMYSADGYYLFFEEREDNETDTSPFWIVSGENRDEQYAYCNEEELSDCGAGSWQKMVQRFDEEGGEGFIGYEVDDKMATNECAANAAMENTNVFQNPMTMVVLAVLIVVLVAVVCVFGCKRKGRKGKAIVADDEDDEYADTKKLAEGDEMQEVDTTQMLQEIEVEVEIETED